MQALLNDSQVLINQPDMLFLMLTALVGLLIGSLLNVMISHFPAMLVQQPTDYTDPVTTFNRLGSRHQPGARLHCVHCQHPLGVPQMIPLIRYLILKGRCHYCQNRISLQYPIVELAAAVIAVFSVQRYGLSQQALVLSLTGFTLLTLSVIDLNTLLLPDRLTLPLLWAGLLYHSLWQPEHLQQAVLGASFGYLILWSVYQLFKLITGKEGMGYGDFKLMAALGAWIGALQLPVLMLLSSVIGLITGLLYRICYPSQHPAVPFGPALAISGWFCMAFPDTVHHFMMWLI